jgi:hypothetical protein
MLGTNDLTRKFSLNPTEIALGVGALLFTIKSLVPPWTNAPKLLLICLRRRSARAGRRPFLTAPTARPDRWPRSTNGRRTGMAQRSSTPELSSRSHRSMA